MPIPMDFQKAVDRYFRIQPRHELGYYLTDIEEFLSSEAYEVFLKWMWGQTMGLTDEDESIVYNQDFDRWYYYYMDGEQAPIYD